MALVTLPFVFTPGTTIKSADMMANLNAIVGDYNGNIQAVNVQAIAEAKITFAATGGHSHAGGTGGTPVQFAQGVDLTSQAALAVGDDGNFFVVTGTVAITSLVSKPSQRLAILRFAASLTLTHSANLILQSAQNLVTQAGDIVAMMSKGGGVWEELWRRLATAPVAPVGTRRYGYRWIDVSNVALDPVTLRAGVLGMEAEVAGLLLTRTTPKTLTMPTSLRALVAGTGNVTVAINSPTLTFSSAQTLKIGDTVKTAGGKFFTIASGSGTSWTAFQNATGNEGPVAFTKSDPGATRTLSGEAVSDALVFVYAFNSGGALDFYLDTTAPVNGYHPYITGDRWSGVQLFNDPSGNLDASWTWVNGVLSFRLQGSAAGDYSTASAAYVDVDAVNLKRAVYVGPGGAVLARGEWQVVGGTTNAGGNLALSRVTPPAAPAGTQVWGTYNNGALNPAGSGHDAFAEQPAAGLYAYGYAYKTDGAGTLILANAAGGLDGNARTPRTPVLLLTVTEP